MNETTNPSSPNRWGGLPITQSPSVKPQHPTNKKDISPIKKSSSVPGYTKRNLQRSPTVDQQNVLKQTAKQSPGKEKNQENLHHVQQPPLLPSKNPKPSELSNDQLPQPPQTSSTKKSHILVPAAPLETTNVFVPMIPPMPGQISTLSQNLMAEKATTNNETQPQCAINAIGPTIAKTEVVSSKNLVKKAPRPLLPLNHSKKKISEGTTENTPDADIGALSTSSALEGDKADHIDNEGDEGKARSAALTHNSVSTISQDLMAEKATANNETQPQSEINSIGPTITQTKVVTSKKLVKKAPRPILPLNHSKKNISEGITVNPPDANVGAPSISSTLELDFAHHVDSKGDAEKAKGATLTHNSANSVCSTHSQNSVSSDDLPLMPPKPHKLPKTKKKKKVVKVPKSTKHSKPSKSTKLTKVPKGDGGIKRSNGLPSAVVKTGKSSKKAKSTKKLPNTAKLQSKSKPLNSAAPNSMNTANTAVPKANPANNPNISGVNCINQKQLNNTSTSHDNASLDPKASSSCTNKSPKMHTMAKEPKKPAMNVADAEVLRRQAISESTIDLLDIDNLRAVSKMTAGEMKEWNGLLGCFLSWGAHDSDDGGKGINIDRNGIVHSDSSGRDDGNADGEEFKTTQPSQKKYNGNGVKEKEIVDLGQSRKRKRANGSLSPTSSMLSSFYVDQFQHNSNHLSMAYHYIHDQSFSLPQCITTSSLPSRTSTNEHNRSLSPSSLCSKSPLDTPADTSAETPAGAPSQTPQITQRRNKNSSSSSATKEGALASAAPVTGEAAGKLPQTSSETPAAAATAKDATRTSASSFHLATIPISLPPSPKRNEPLPLSTVTSTKAVIQAQKEGSTNHTSNAVSINVSKDVASKKGTSIASTCPSNEASGFSSNSVPTVVHLSDEQDQNRKVAGTNESLLTSNLKKSECGSSVAQQVDTKIDVNVGLEKNSGVVDSKADLNHPSNSTKMQSRKERAYAHATDNTVDVKTDNLNNTITSPKNDVGNFKRAIDSNCEEDANDVDTEEIDLSPLVHLWQKLTASSSLKFDHLVSNEFRSVIRAVLMQGMQQKDSTNNNSSREDGNKEIEGFVRLFSVEVRQKWLRPSTSTKDTLPKIDRSFYPFSTSSSKLFTSNREGSTKRSENENKEIVQNESQKIPKTCNNESSMNSEKILSALSTFARKYGLGFRFCDNKSFLDFFNMIAPGIVLPSCQDVMEHW